VELEENIDEVREAATALLADTFTPDPEDEINLADILLAARTRVESDIPAGLRIRGRARAALVAAKLSGYRSFQNLVTASARIHVASSTGASGLVAQRWGEYESAENNLKAYALSTINQYQRAIGLLTAITTSKELTSAEADAIAAVALADDADAVTTEATLHEARANIIAKELEIESAVIAARIADIDADPDADTDVQDLKIELTTLEATLTAAESAHTAEFPTAMDLWEVTLPDQIWANLQNFDTAIALLTSVSTSDAAILTSALTTAETNLVNALDADDDGEILRGYLANAVSAAAAEAQYFSGVERAVTLSAMRGDY
jgi:hypothetical protein